MHYINEFLDNESCVTDVCACVIAKLIPNNKVVCVMIFAPMVHSGTEKVPHRTCATKILPNFRVNFLLRFASKP